MCKIKQVEYDFITRFAFGGRLVRLGKMSSDLDGADEILVQ